MRTMRRGCWAFPRWTARLCLCVLLVAAGTRAQAREISTMSGDEITVLQQRLTDAGCYTGAIDGAPSAALDNAVKACPDQQPELRIETGMHTLMVRGIGVDAACDLAVTGSHDGTARVWSLPDGRLLRTVRPPLRINKTDSGQILAAAMSPDGRTAAISVEDAFGEKRGNYVVYLFDPRAGDTLRRIGPFGGLVLRLAFSPDGRRLAVGLKPTIAINAVGQNPTIAINNDPLRLFDVASGRQLASASGFFFGISGLAFGANGDLYAMASDGDLRHYDRALNELAKTKVDGPALAASDLDVDPTGRRIAIAYRATPGVYLVDARSLSIVAKAGTSSDGAFSTVAWTRNGLLIAGGGPNVRTFDFEGRRLGDVQRV
jgi:WD40 repeat protein